MDFVLGIIYSQLVIALLLFVHEMGHYLALKALKIKVDTFSIGVGKGFTLFNYQGTAFRLAPLLIGAYVKPNVSDYEAAHPYKRLIVSVSGSALGIAAAIIPFFIISFKYLHYDFFSAVSFSFEFVWNLVCYFAEMLANFFVWVFEKIFHIHKEVVAVASSTSTVAAGSITDKAGRFSDNYTFMQGASFAKALVMIGLLSIFINIVNLVPMLPLDGGHVIVHIYEIIFKKSPPKWLFTSVFLFGVAILAALLFVSLFNDIKHLF